MAAVIFAAYSLRLSYKPADESHLYGHAKISFFSAGFEGAMIILAAFYIISPPPAHTIPAFGCRRCKPTASPAPIRQGT